MIRFSRRTAPILLLTGFLGGCSTMLPHYRMTTEGTQMMGFGTAAVRFCVDRGTQFPQEQLVAHNTAAETILAQAVLEREVLDARYTQTLDGLAGLTPEEQASFCQTTETNLPRYVSWLQQTAGAAVNARAVGLSTMAAAPAAPPPIVFDLPMPSGEVTYTQGREAADKGAFTVISPGNVTTCAVNGNMAYCP